MLRFNTYLRQALRTTNWHFNTSYVTVQPLFHVQIGQKRLYFNTSYVTVQLAEHLSTNRIQPNFNTSYVTVQLKNKQFSLYFIKISIHLMLRFNLQLNHPFA